jgi:hypothetical protein
MTTPYELRYKILELARAHLLEKYYAARDIAQQRANINENVIELNDVEAQYPTLEQITELANQMKGFVEAK